MIKDPMSGLQVQPGDFAAARMGGEGGRLIRIGEVLCRFPKDNPAGTDWEHALTYIGGPDDLIIEAEPGGAKIRPYHYAPGTLLWSTGRPALALSPEQRDRVPAVAEHYRDVGYSALDYFAIALHHFRIPVPGLQSYIASTGHYMCSALTDQIRLDLGSHLFTRPPRWQGYVTPLDIAGLIGGSALA